MEVTSALSRSCGKGENIGTGGLQLQLFDSAVVPLSAAVFLTSAAVIPEKEVEQSCQGSEDA